MEDNLFFDRYIKGIKNQANRVPRNDLSFHLIHIEDDE